MQGYLLVFLGAGVGGALRHAVNLAAVRMLPAAIGASTLFVNIVGSFAMGVLIEYLALKGQATQNMRLLLATGVLGGFTTFSAFSLETVMLSERGQLGLAALYVIGSVLLSVLALLGGLFLVRQWAA